MNDDPSNFTLTSEQNQRLQRFINVLYDALVEKCAEIAEQIDECTEYTYDQGFTLDGYRQAKQQISQAIRNMKHKENSNE